jgi:hypothetical protein
LKRDQKTQKKKSYRLMMKAVTAENINKNFLQEKAVEATKQEKERKEEKTAENIQNIGIIANARKFIL